VEVDLKNKPQELRELNPYGKVPVLVDDQAVIYESNIIDEYLEEKYPDVCLMPGDPAARARARIWMDYCNTRLHGAAHDILHGDNQEKAQEKLKDYLTALELEMAGREYLAGGYSLADITLIPFFIRRQRYRFEIDQRLPNLQRWMDRMLARPAVQSTL
jgi:glutathione S-transferase